MTAPGQPPVMYSYDPASRLTAITQASQLVELEYDATGRRTKLTLPNQVSTEYQYDPGSRLTALLYGNAVGPLGDLTYQYDSAGNRTGVGGSFARTLLPAPVDSASYDAANRQLVFGPTRLTFDANGSLLTVTEPWGVTSFTWDARNRLQAATTPFSSATFVYDPRDRRSTRAVDGVTTRYLYDGIDAIEDQTDTTSHAYLRSSLIDEPLARAGSEFYLQDALGSIIGLTGNTGAVMTSYTYEPFGVTALTDAPTSNPFAYTGREMDLGGLYYYRARYYHPGLQRFVAEDPLPPHFRFVNELNAYAYVANNPILLSDPFGLFGALPGTHYCGPGGSGPVLNVTDGCCKEHDECYGRAEVTWQHNVYKQPTAQQRRCIGNCDDTLCWCLSRATLTTNNERRARSAAQFYFCRQFPFAAP
jgi:RHS repeat-associated protein